MYEANFFSIKNLSTIADYIQLIIHIIQTFENVVTRWYVLYVRKIQLPVPILVIIARWPPLQRRWTRLKHGGERQSRVVMVWCWRGRLLLCKNIIIVKTKQTATSPEKPKHLLIIIIVTCGDIFISKFDVLASTFQHKFHIVEFQVRTYVHKQNKTIWMYIFR